LLIYKDVERWGWQEGVFQEVALLDTSEEVPDRKGMEESSLEPGREPEAGGS
jgi:hypothetical protein